MTRAAIVGLVLVLAAAAGARETDAPAPGAVEGHRYWAVTWDGFIHTDAVVGSCRFWFGDDEWECWIQDASTGGSIFHRKAEGTLVQDGQRIEFLHSGDERFGHFANLRFALSRSGSELTTAPVAETGAEAPFLTVTRGLIDYHGSLYDADAPAHRRRPPGVRASGHGGRPGRDERGRPKR